jgi:2-iminobutanoate/2-iminopropanoate deaminase
VGLVPTRVYQALRLKRAINVSMSRILLPPLLLSLICLPVAAQVRAVIPKSAPAPVGPYTPGVFAGDYLYVSGQGAKAPDGSMPSGIEAQVKQTLENVKSVVEAAGLTLDNVVYTQVYLDDINKFDAMNAVYEKYFPSMPPARATLGVAKLPGTPVEINAVAFRDASQKKAIAITGYNPGEPVSPGILTADRLFISGMRGRSRADGAIPAGAAEQVTLALDGVKAVVEAAGLKMASVAFVNPYLTASIPMNVMNELYARQFEFGNTPARATIQVASLPQGAQIEFTGVAVRDLAQRRSIRPKNMAPSPTASPCVFAGDTLYCSAKSGFIPGVNGGIFAATVDHQLRQTMRNLLDNLEEAGMDFTNVVAANVYLDDLQDFQAMNRVYAKYFKGIPPARTTIQQVPPGNRSPNEEGVYPTLEQISIVAVRQSGKP